jgi:hypothetical protein
MLAGCGSSTRAAATRVLDPQAAAFTKTPVCFVPSRPEADLIERDRQAKLARVCESAVAEDGVAVAAFGTQGCLPVTMIWQVADTGIREGNCSSSFGGVDCSSSAVHRKSVKVVLTRPGTNQALIETIAAIDSNFGSFSEKSFRALCSAAFHDYPSPLQSERFDVSLD